MNLGDMTARAHGTAVEKGFHENDVPADDKGVTFAHRMLLIISELSEALEELRDGHAVDETYYSYTLSFPSGKVKHLSADLVWDIYGLSPEELGLTPQPEGFGVEIADAFIRILDLAGTYGLDLEKIVAEKMGFNAGREARHGRQF